MPDFIPGLEQCRLYYQEAVAPILKSDFPNLKYSAALIGNGSEVLGFDTEMSTDHDWGPRLQLFLSEEEHPRVEKALRETLRRKLPPSFRDYPTGFPGTETANDPGEEKRPDIHRVEPMTISDFVFRYLDFDLRQDILPADWLTFPEQKLRTLTTGAVYFDGLGLQAVRERFRYYPQDVWLYLLAAGWNRIGQEEHLMGRDGSVGDELGSAVIAARLVRDLMRLCFLMEKQYAPYPKWLGTAFSQLRCAPETSPAPRAHIESGDMAGARGISGTGVCLRSDHAQCSENYGRASYRNVLLL